MAYDLLTTSGITSLVTDYKNAQYSTRLTPLSKRKTYYQTLDSAYSTISAKLSSLNTILTSLSSTDSTSVFSAKKSSSSATSFVSITTTSSASVNSSTVRINQLAKTDLAVSKELSSDAISADITSAGTHEFIITAGDGAGGTVASKVSVTFEESDFTDGQISNKNVMSKIQTAINLDKAEINSGSVDGATSASGGSFKINLNGTETTIDYSADTYSNIIDSAVTEINKLAGVKAEKIADGSSNYKLKITVTDTSKYISLSDVTGSLISDLSMTTVKEKGASGVVTASRFSPTSATSRISLTSKQSGYDYRITAFSEDLNNNVLTAIGMDNMNPGGRLMYDKVATPTQAGYVIAENNLNAKFEFNGMDLERNSNTISDLLSGSTIQLKSVMQTSDTTVDLSVEKDNSTARTKIQDFINSFNDIYSYLKTNLTNTKDGRGSLNGDSTATSLQSMFSAIATSAVSGISADQINSLNKIGISFDVIKGLTLSDSAILDTALTNHPEQVASLFNSTSGIAATLSARISPYLGSTGYITTRKNSFSQTITSINDTGTAIQAKIDKAGEALRSRYIKMQMQLQSMLDLQSSFSSYFSNLNGLS
ncbi:MAG: flagellar cap protein FliD [Ignavibacteriae bacterium HGW-Ignavibacteriae-3]|nr:MAG: flagellar cap protein FliD [Ignavibacteriae bacterium HGW-Ignavibacteriae-3]